MNAEELAAELERQGIDANWAAWREHDRKQEDWSKGMVAQARGNLALAHPFFFPDFAEE